MSGNLITQTRLLNLQRALRCHATAKRTGQRCRCAATKGWRVCYVHGARGGAPRGSAHPNYRHGGRTTETIEMRRELAQLLRSTSELCSEI